MEKKEKEVMSPEEKKKKYSKAERNAWKKMIDKKRGIKSAVPPVIIIREGIKKRVKSQSLADKCREISPDLFDELKFLAMSPQGKYKQAGVKLNAINALLDRAYGKPKETITNVQSPRIIEIIRPTAKPEKKLGLGTGNHTTPPKIMPVVAEEGTAH